MIRVCVAAGALLLAAGCGSSSAAAPAKTVTVAPTPTVSFDDMGRHACDAASKDAWLAAQGAAKLSMVKDLQDLALREEQLGNHQLIKAWCAQNYHGQ